VIALLGACARQAPTPPAPLPPAGGPWIQTVRADHPLVGTIWSVSERRPIGEPELIEALRGVDHVLLGEKHDNADHHRLQARIIAAVGPRAVGFEMLDADDPVGAPDPEGLAAAVAWEESGWPPFALYRPVFEAVYGAGAEVVAAHPPRETVLTAMRQGLEALPAEVTADLPVRPLTEQARADLGDEIVDAHCGHAPPDLVEKMVRAQVLKDAWMAREIGRAGPGTALVAGGGHTRLDRGVPWYLEGTVAVVELVEVDADRTDPGSYDAAATWLWFTPRVDDVDPCERFREQLRQMHP
jgi:uncharacterized iron-regulated protein